MFHTRWSAAALAVLLCAGAHVTRAADDVSDLPARFRYVFDDHAREVFLRNSQPLIRAKLRMNPGREWLFVYADMGGGNSPVRWQGLVGIRVGQDAHLLGGWRRVTYDFSPGGEFDALDFDGPFIGAQRAW